MRIKKKRSKTKKMKNSYISLLILSVLAVMAVFYVPPKFQGFAIQDGVFNLEVELPSIYGTVEGGEEIHFTTKILNLAGEDRMDISLRYEIIGNDSRIIVSKTETMAIETQASFVGSLDIPPETTGGDYELLVTLLVNDTEEAEGRSSFKIMKEEDKSMYYAYIILVSIISLALIIYLVSKSKVIFEKLRTRSKIHKMIKKKLGD